MEARDAEALANLLEQAARAFRAMAVREGARLQHDRIETDPRPLALTVREAAEELRVSRATVYALMNEGGLPSVRLGSARRIVRSALAQWLAEQAANA